MTIYDSPAAIKKALDKKVIGQDQAKWDLAHAFFLYEMRMYEAYQGRHTDFRSHVMLVGPSGSGKTHLIKSLAETTEVPLLSVDCSSLSAPGWSGTNVYEELRRQQPKAEPEDARTNLVIIVLDNLDAITGTAETSTGQDHNERIQNSLFGLLDGIEFASSERGVSIYPEYAFIVATGTFNKLKTVSCYKENIRKSVINAGIKKDLMERFMTVTLLDDHALNNLDEVLEIESSPLAFYKTIFKRLNIPFSITSLEKEQLGCALKSHGIRGLQHKAYEIMRTRLEDVPYSEALLLPPALRTEEDTND